MSTLFNKPSSDNTVAVTQQLLHHLHIPFSYSGLKESIRQHPDYPSIAAVHDVLIKYKTDNIVLQVNKEKLQEVPVPFVAHLQQKPSGFVTVTSVHASKVTFLKPGTFKKETTITTDEFINRWSGITGRKE